MVNFQIASGCQKIEASHAFAGFRIVVSCNESSGKFVRNLLSAGYKHVEFVDLSDHFAVEHHGIRTLGEFDFPDIFSDFGSGSPSGQYFAFSFENGLQLSVCGAGSNDLQRFFSSRPGSDRGVAAVDSRKYPDGISRQGLVDSFLKGLKRSIFCARIFVIS